MIKNIVRNGLTSVIGGVAGITEIAEGLQQCNRVMMIRGVLIFLLGLVAKDGHNSDAQRPNEIHSMKTKKGQG